MGEQFSRTGSGAGQLAQPVATTLGRAELRDGGELVISGGETEVQQPECRLYHRSRPPRARGDSPAPTAKAVAELGGITCAGVVCAPCRQRSAPGHRQLLRARRCSPTSVTRSRLRPRRRSRAFGPTGRSDRPPGRYRGPATPHGAPAGRSTPAQRCRSPTSPAAVRATGAMSSSTPSRARARSAGVGAGSTHRDPERGRAILEFLDRGRRGGCGVRVHDGGPDVPAGLGPDDRPPSAGIRVLRGEGGAPTAQPISTAQGRNDDALHRLSSKGVPGGLDGLVDGQPAGLAEHGCRRCVPVLCASQRCRRPSAPDPRHRVCPSTDHRTQCPSPPRAVASLQCSHPNACRAFSLGINRFPESDRDASTITGTARCCRVRASSRCGIGNPVSYRGRTTWYAVPT